MNKTLNFFEEISQIPRPSGKEEQICKFLVDFAKNRNLECFTDNFYNVIIKKKSNIQNCNKTLILQAHTDMVCEKNNDVNFNFETMGINLVKENDFLHANGTTLGADNGIGLSMILSVLDNESIKIPNLECIFTTQEETTMLGAMNIDFSKLNGQHLLSIDGTDEAKIEVSSAGMVVAEFEKNMTLENTKEETSLKLTLTGLMGGHSGSEIHTNRKNSIKLMFAFLKQLENIKFIEINGGGKSNAIPRECCCTIITSTPSTKIKTEAEKFFESFKNCEPNIKFMLEEIVNTNRKHISCADSKNLIDFVNEQENGVLIYSKEEKDFPIVSNNFANIKLENGYLHAVISLRSSVEELEKVKLNELFTLADKHNIKHEITSVAPFFEKKENSYLQNICTTSYKELFNKPAIVEGVHAGLEGGVFAQKNKNLDICVIAPNIYDAHSPKERVSLSSIQRVYNWLVKIIEKF